MLRGGQGVLSRKGLTEKVTSEQKQQRSRGVGDRSRQREQ